MDVFIENVTKSYHDGSEKLTVIDRLSLNIPAGKTTALIGRSGVGKSTLLHLLGGLDHPDSGEVIIGGIKLSTLDGDEMASFRAKNVGFVFQFHHLLPEFTAIENVTMPLLIAGVGKKEAHSRGIELLKRVGLEARSHHLPSQLSGGEGQRLAICRSIINRSRLVLADEPTGNLDIKNASIVGELLLSFPKDFGTTLIIVTHSMELAREADTIIEILPGGKTQNFDSLV
jgi:lipoprotein-releasing system ATP-binding protein